MYQNVCVCDVFFSGWPWTGGARTCVWRPASQILSEVLWAHWASFVVGRISFLSICLPVSGSKCLTDFDSESDSVILRLQTWLKYAQNWLRKPPSLDVLFPILQVHRCPCCTVFSRFSPAVSRLPNEGTLSVWEAHKWTSKSTPSHIWYHLIFLQFVWSFSTCSLWPHWFLIT